MTNRYRRRQIALAALAANALFPRRGSKTGPWSFAAGWPTLELAPHLLVAAAADTAAELTVRRRKGRQSGGRPSRVGLLAAGTAAGLLAYSVKVSRGVGLGLDSDLAEGLGANTELTPHHPRARGSIARPFKLKQHNVEVLRNVPYTEGGRRSRLDIYRPAGVDLTKAPVLLQIHGGGWTIGSKEQQGLILMNRMAQQGWICVASNYRLAPKHRYPAQIEDVKRAIAWVHENIEQYGGDRDYVVITGGSAGGHLCSLAALTANDPKFQPGFEDADTSISACVPFYGVYDMAGLTGSRASTEFRDKFLAPWVFAKDPVKDRQAFVDASPLAHVSADAPDFFVLHGANDTLVPVEQARTFVAAMRETSNATVTYSELPFAQHAFDVFSSLRSQQAIDAVQRWLTWHRATTQTQGSE